MVSPAVSQVLVQDFTNSLVLTNMAGWVDEPTGFATMSSDLDPVGAVGALCLDPTNISTSVSREVLQNEGGPWLGGTSTIAFADFWVRPVAEPATNAVTSIGLDGARVGFLRDGTVGRAFVFDGDGQGGGTAQDTDYTFAVGASGASSNWVRVTVRRDFASPQFDAWFDGVVYAVGVGPDETNAQSSPALFVLEGHESAANWLDLYSLSPDNPLFEDEDRDGMPDDFEVSRGLNPGANDRDGDADGDGTENIGEYAMGTSPDDPASYPGATNVIYVDGALGDDLFNGLSSHPSATGGPKQTIGAGLGTAEVLGNPTAIVMIRETTNAYTESSMGSGTNTVIVRPVGNVVIQP